MKKIKTLFCLTALFPLVVFASDEPDYSVKNIKPELLKNANVVVRSYELETDIVSLTEVNTREHLVVTVLNEKGDRYANCVEVYSGLQKIEHISGYIYDGNGETVTKIKQSDFKDVLMFSAYPEYSDNKYKTYNVNYRKYPYTVEYIIEVSQNHTFALPEWSPATGAHCSIEAANLTVTTHGNASLRYKQFLAGEPKVVNGLEQKQYTWSLRSFPAWKPEPLSKTEYPTPTILLATDNFMMDDYAGNMTTWLQFGKFIYDINKGRDLLPPDVKVKAAQLISGAKDDRQKVGELYTYLQNTMRYVAVEYGIGGWQSLDAAFLSKNQYGDCKALSNYMMALLGEAGIQAYPVTIFAGVENDHTLLKDFVCNQTNHVILCVPLANDTMWLECTSAELPAGYLSDFTQNRDALMITPAGGILVHTPAYDTSINFAQHHAYITIGEEGLNVSMNNLYSGEAATNLYHVMKYDNDHQKQEYLQSKFHLSSYTVDDYAFQKIDNAAVTKVSEKVKISVAGLYTKTGSRSFVMLDVCPIDMSAPYEDNERKTPFYLPESEAYCDTVEMDIPQQCEVEFIPPAVSMRYPFGSYSCAITKEGNKLVMVRKLTINGNTYEPTLYESYLKLVSILNNESHKKVVLKNKR